jgi:hypothetical protein
MQCEGWSVWGALRSPGKLVDLPLGMECSAVEFMGPSADWLSAIRGSDVVIHLADRVHVEEKTYEDSIQAYREVKAAGTVRLAQMAAPKGCAASSSRAPWGCMRPLRGPGAFPNKMNLPPMMPTRCLDGRRNKSLPGFARTWGWGKSLSAARWCMDLGIRGTSCDCRNGLNAGFLFLWPTLETAAA